jgi:hypothetical protein
MKRALFALGLSAVLMLTISLPAPPVEALWLAFSFQGDTEGYVVTSIDQPFEPATVRPIQVHTSVLDEHTSLLLDGGSLAVVHRGQELWRSDPSWDVRELLAADLNSDGDQEVAYAVWKPFHPDPPIFYDVFGFPAAWEEGSLRNHLFIYEWRDDAWRPLWCSSPLADPIVSMAVGDVDGDGANELVVLEGSYDAPDAPTRHVGVRRWNGWGFTLQWRSPAGAYAHLQLHDITGDGGPDILVQDRS